MSKKPKSTFIELCVRGQVLLEDIDDYVDTWHEGNFDQELHEFLGMDEDEYALWMRDASVLPFIVTAHAKRRSLNEVLEEYNGLPIAARSNQSHVEKLLDWLQQQGKLD
jgi:hypothetical protein